MILTLLIVCYVICALLLTLYALGSVVLLIAYWLHRHDRVVTPQINVWPHVAVQLPIYNERYVVERLLDAVASLDYPHDRLVIQVLDDSNDETTEILAQKVAALKAQGLKIDHIRRENRSGYKAGALAYGLALLKSEYVAVLDADFVPPPHFLRATVPFMVKDPQLGMVQGRWGHLNSFNNLLTMGQMLALDGHFVVEQTGRNRSGWLINFNGSGGIWRTKTIRDAGGWNDNTLTEDLDLSYRAQLKGWRFLYLPEVVVPGELPPQLNAYKQQQARWAKGGTQCLSILISPIWQSTDLTLTQRLMATMHLCQYMTAPLMIILLLLTPPLMLVGGMNRIPLGPLGLAGLGPPLVFIASQRALYGNWKRRALIFPALMVLGTGMAWNNTKAVLEGLFKKKGEFKRTPKYATVATSKNKYGLRGSAASLIELGLALYSLVGLLLAVDLYAGLAPFMFIYTIAFGAVALWGLSENLHIVRIHRAPTTTT